MGLDGISLEFHYFLLFKGKVSIISSSKDLIKEIIDFQNLMEIEFWSRVIFEIWIIHKPPLGSREVQHEIWARQGLAALTFIEHRRTDRQTDQQNTKIDITCGITGCFHILLKRQKLYIEDKPLLLIYRLHEFQLVSIKS